MIVLRDVTLRRGVKEVLRQASVTLHPGEKIGLVGRNGAGKSSLFGLLSGHLHEDGGDFSMPAQWRMAQVAQELPETDEPADRFVLAGDTRILDLQARLAQAEATGDGLALAQAHADLQDAGWHDALPRAQALILGLGFSVAQLQQPVNSFSGGWRMRLQLARALMCPSDLLLLDEPTNHLDLDALVWLEAWLQRYAGTLVVISHDREFLDAVTRVTLHIEDGLLTRWGGNYSAFETLRAQQMALQQAAYSRQQDRIAHLQSFIDRFKAKATKARQAQSRVKALERMALIAPVLTAADFSFEFRAPASLPNPMLSLSGARLGYRSDGQERTILDQVDRTVLAGQRIGILGANGQGKSTLVKTITGQLPLLAGQMTEGKGLSVGYYAQQELDVLRADETPLQHMVRLARQLGQDQSEAGREQSVRTHLGSFQFAGDMVMQTVGTMSGGEKARLALAMIVWQRPNLLLLDEPTNHLDLNTREALSVALNEFEGTVLLVSHDRALLRSVCDEFWLVSDGRVKPFDGDLEDYQQHLLEQARRLREAAAQALAGGRSASDAPSGAEQRRQQAQQRQALAAQLRPLKKEVAQIEATLAAHEAEREALYARMVGDGSPEQRAEDGRRLKVLEGEIESLELRWMECSQQLQDLQAQGA